MRRATLYSADPDEVGGIVRDLDLLGIVCGVAALESPSSDEGRPDLALLWTGPDAPGALAFGQVLRKEEGMREVPLLALVRLEHLRELFLREGTFDDFLVVPYQLPELEARIRHLLWRAKQTEQPDVLSFGGLEVNVATYQVHVDGDPVDLTFMEMELLKFLAQHKGRVFTRQQLLSRVWGYDYFGGTRTVDVHVRRLRSKLGRHASVVQTVRNVGYKFLA